ncbi:hypothetical protein HAX54_042779 [Datura stramonium]|uniref:Uncharacterized protein n=1 Tax=Datura stramonium TaxID=4076 RepID=A0ABS8W4H8_DATST|nr:hypothetical protein [Datura stramonium]
MELLEMFIRQVMETKVCSVNVIGTVERMEQFEDEVYFLNDEKEGVLTNHSVVPSPLIEKKAKPLDTRIWESRSGKIPHTRVESVDEENMEQDYEAILFKDSVEAILLNRDSKGIEGLE